MFEMTAAVVTATMALLIAVLVRKVIVIINCIEDLQTRLLRLQGHLMQTLKIARALSEKNNAIHHDLIELVGQLEEHEVKIDMGRFKTPF